MEIECIWDRATGEVSENARQILRRLIEKDGEPDRAWLGVTASSDVQYLFSVESAGNEYYFHAYKINGEDWRGVKMHRLSFTEYVALLRKSLEAVVSTSGELRIVRTENYHPYDGFSVNFAISEVQNGADISFEWLKRVGRTISRWSRNRSCF